MLKEKEKPLLTPPLLPPQVLTTESKNPKNNIPKKDSNLTQERSLHTLGKEVTAGLIIIRL